MFTSRSVLISLVAAAACFAMPAQSADGVFTAAMDGAQCLPDAIQTPATGTVELRLSADGKKIDYKVTVNKLLNPSQADLHIGAASQNGQVAVKLWPPGNASGKRGEFTGVLAEGSFDAATSSARWRARRCPTWWTRSAPATRTSTCTPTTAWTRRTRVRATTASARSAAS